GGPRGRVVDDGHAQRRLATRLDGAIQLGRELSLKLLARRDGHPARRRARQTLACSGGPVQLAPRERTPEPGRGPGTHVEKPIPRAREAVRPDRPAALGEEAGAVSEP